MDECGYLLCVFSGVFCDLCKYIYQIWLVGLGVFVCVEEEGSGFFDVLVEVGCEVECCVKDKVLCVGELKEWVCYYIGEIMDCMEKVFDDWFGKVLFWLGIFNKCEVDVL